ncbi:hypothetical protein AAH50_000105 [Campylobacter lari]|nr:hypothetical protein [Campylobacter lari]
MKKSDKLFFLLSYRQFSILSILTYKKYIQLRDEINQFIQEHKSIMISSLNLNNQTICSYAPIIKIKNDFYIYISEISEHLKELNTIIKT